MVFWFLAFGLRSKLILWCDVTVISLILVDIFAVLRSEAMYSCDLHSLQSIFAWMMPLCRYQLLEYVPFFGGKVISERSVEGGWVMSVLVTNLNNGDTYKVAGVHR